LPETDHDGLADWGLNYDYSGASLKPLPPSIGLWAGKWGAGGVTGSPASPGVSSQQPPRPASVAAQARRARARHAARTEGVSRCGSWFGADVAALVCGARLGRAVREAKLGRRARLRISVVRRPESGRRLVVRGTAVRSLGQVLAAPLRVGDRVRVQGPVPAGVRIRVRAVRGDRLARVRTKIRRPARTRVDAVVVRRDNKLGLRVRSR
jgi:hypothetical protein